MNMYNPFNTTACTSQSQRMNEAQQHLIKAFVRLIAKKDGRKQRWVGTKTDLLEMAHLAYTFSSVRDEQGRPATFLWMARHVCTNFHLSITPSKLLCLSAIVTCSSKKASKNLCAHG